MLILIFICIACIIFLAIKYWLSLKQQHETQAHLANISNLVDQKDAIIAREQSKTHNLHMKLQQANDDRNKKNSEIAQQEELIHAYKEKLHEKELKIDFLSKSKKNQGEMFAYRDLQTLQSELIRANIIKSADEFVIHSNLMFIASNMGQEYVHQIDHLVVASWGIFMLETKYWRGVIFNECTKKDVQPEHYKILFPNDNKIKTFTITNDTNGISRNVFDTKSPCTQVRTTSLKLHEHLLVHLEKKLYIKALVNYNYKRDQNNFVVDGSNLLDTVCNETTGFTNYTSMRSYFYGAQKSSSVNHTEEDLQLINDFIVSNL
ncbi:hypothetical protein HCJ07_05290 [Listeria booriae]|uniref:nuclease-related domain-containing protein n=1 Tax=Listeria booriae TaxID=1552123 RepID=UPI001625D43F|nr:nuclease-related domain-containing protein [Listeria booriae]MBC1502439.1 hypothetical protein [Listeria booriae]MBC1523468.1 hypothetical protein [Listeria booriae]MBC1529753.1 hypothetical protein [Listeria booriae]